MSPKSHIFSMFGTSPIRPMQSHMAKVQACVTLLPPFFEAALGGDWEAARGLQGQILALEEDADGLKRQLRLNLPGGLLMAVSRRDFLETLTLQDRIANTAKKVAGQVMARRMRFPDEVAPLLMSLVRRSIDATTQAQTAVNELDELVETGFRGREVNLVESMITRLDAIEADTDAMQVELRAQLFATEPHLAPVDVVFMYHIIDWLGDLADLAQQVGNRLELMLAR